MGRYKLGGVDISSSVNPNELASTVQAMILGLSSLIIMIAAAKGYSITTEQVSVAASQIGIAVSSIWFTYGMIRKILVAYSQK